MDILLNIILIFLAALLLYASYLIYRKKKLETKTTLRMMVAVRRSPSGHLHFLQMDNKRQAATRIELDREWQILQSKWRMLGTFLGGIGSCDAGLPSGAEGDWILFGLFDLRNYKSYQLCQAAFTEPQFTKLRNFCEIRLILGKILSKDLNNQLQSLF
jgi:hypothetical protein